MCQYHCQISLSQDRLEVFCLQSIAFLITFPYLFCTHVLIACPTFDFPLHRGARAEEAVSHLESNAASMRSRTLSLEGALRVKEREIERLTRLSEAAKVHCLRFMCACVCDSVHPHACLVLTTTCYVILSCYTQLLNSYPTQVVEANVSARLSRAEDTARKLEGDLAAGRVRCAQVCVRGRVGKLIFQVHLCALPHSRVSCLS